MTAPFVKYIIGNEYEEIPANEAKLDRSGRYLKTKKWTVYVDIIEGDKTIIAKVKADMGHSFPRIYEWNRCKEIRQPNGRKSRWRCFESTQCTYAWVDIDFTVTGIGGTKSPTVSYRVREYKHEESEPFHFVENRPPQQRFRRLPLSDDIRFHVILEKEDTLHGESTGICMELNHPNGNGYQSGEKGVQKYSDMVKANSGVKLLPSVQVNVKDRPREAILKICQNAIKYEDAIYDIMLRHDDNKTRGLYLSNKAAISGNSNKARHQKLASCKTIQELRDCMNPDKSAPYKFNIVDASAAAGSDAAVDSCEAVKFCFSMATTDGTVIEALIMFSVLFVDNSIRLRSPSNFKENNSTTVGEQLDFLFNLIKDGYVESVLRTQEEDTHLNCGIGTFDFTRSLKGMSMSDVGSRMSNSICSNDMDLTVGMDSLSNNGTYPTDYPSFPSRKRLRHESDGEAQASHQVGHQVGPVPPRSVSNLTSETARKPPKTVHKEMKVKKFSHAVLGSILGRVNASAGNKKGMREEALTEYFDAREKELRHFFETQGKNNEDEGILVGIEVLPETKMDQTDEIQVYIRGGRKLVRTKRGSCTPKIDEISVVSEAELSGVLSSLGRPVAEDAEGRISELNMYIDEVFAEEQNPGQPQNSYKEDDNFVMCYRYVP
jgi:hypothetical protein